MWIIKVGEQFGYIYGFACTCLCCVNGWPQFLKTSRKTVLLPSTVKASRTKVHNLTFYFMSFCPSYHYWSQDIIVEGLENGREGCFYSQRSTFSILRKDQENALTKRIIFQCMCLQNPSKISLTPKIRRHMKCVGTVRQLLKITPLLSP